MWFPDILSPQSHLEIILDNWRVGVRGQDPTDEEWREFFRWLHRGDTCSLEEPRPFQMFIHLFDKQLTGLDANPGKVVRIGEDDSSRLRELERLIRDLGAVYELDGKELSILDLWLEGQCAAQALQLSRAMQRHWKELRVVLVDANLSEETFEYLEEASTSYLFGQYRACVSLCRSALELSLKESLDLPSGSEHKLIELIRTAKDRGLLAGRYYRFATEVRREANKVIHPRREVSGEEAREILKLTGYVVEAQSDI